MDEAGFQRAMDEQRERARKSAGSRWSPPSRSLTELADKIKSADAISVQLHETAVVRKYVPTEFVGYEHFERYRSFNLSLDMITSSKKRWKAMRWNWSWTGRRFMRRAEGRSAIKA